MNCPAFNSSGWAVCTLTSSGQLPFYEYRPSNLVAAFAPNFPHGSLHAPSTPIPAFGVNEQGPRLGAPVTAGTSYLVWKPTNTGNTCLNNVKFLLNPFYQGALVNTGFPHAFSNPNTNAFAPRYNLISDGVGTQWTYSQPYAFLRSQASPACGN